jgi:zona occludens toxin (predicted ATPase)
MAIKIYSGLPGKGKTASASHYAIKHYNKMNGLIRKIKKMPKINNVYSNYPILLDAKNNVYSNLLDIRAMNMKFCFPKDSVLILDEVQRYYDSREFKTFPKDLGTFMQHHRHGDIKDIILITQHPRRIDNKMRDLAEVFVKYRIWFNIPLLPFIFVYYTNYYEHDDFGKYHHVKKEMQNYDYDNHFKFISKKVYKSYNSKYFNVIFRTLPPMYNHRYQNKDLTVEHIKTLF